MYQRPLFKRIVSSVIILCSLNSCGFSPVYSNKQPTELGWKLASIALPEAKNRQEQIFINALHTLLTPTGNKEQSEYELIPRLTVTKSDLAIERDRTVTRYKIIANLEYRIQEIATGQEIGHGSLQRQGEFDRVTSDYSTYISQKNTEKKVIEALAEDMRLRLVWILNPKNAHENSQ